MIRITLLDGPYAGQTRTSDDVQGIESMDVLQGLVQHGWRWKIDFTQATPPELLEWGRADLVVRILRALGESRSVFFLGIEFSDSSEEGVGLLEDTISNSGRDVFVEKDDENGLVIGTRGDPPTN